MTEIDASPGPLLNLQEMHRLSSCERQSTSGPVGGAPSRYRDSVLNHCAYVEGSHEQRPRHPQSHDLIRTTEQGWQRDNEIPSST